MKKVLDTIQTAMMLLLPDKWNSSYREFRKTILKLFNKNKSKVSRIIGSGDYIVIRKDKLIIDETIDNNGRMNTSIRIKPKEATKDGRQESKEPGRTQS